MLKRLFPIPAIAVEPEQEQEDTFPPVTQDLCQSPFKVSSKQTVRPNKRRSSFGGIPRGGVDITTPNERVLDLLDRLLNDEPIRKIEVLQLKTLVKESRNIYKPTDLRQQLLQKYSGDREDVGIALTELIDGKATPSIITQRTKSADDSNDFARYSRDIPRNLMKAESFWDFDAFALDHSTYNNPVQALTLHLIRLIPEIDTLNINFEKLQSYLRVVESGHHKHPYHGPHHVAAVVQRFHLLIQNGLNASGLLTPLTTLACYIAAAVHDYGHTGFTNDYLVRTEHPFAITYNDIACQENFHCFAAMKLLRNNDYAFLERKADYLQLRKLVIAMVLETDMSRHFEATDRFRSLPAEIKLDRDRDTILKLALKCSDLNHCGISFSTHRRWVELLNKEFWAQGDLQHQQGWEVSPLMSRNGPGLASTQAGFFEIIVLPLFQVFVDRFPDTQPMLTYARQNLESWRDVNPTASRD